LRNGYKLGLYYISKIWLKFEFRLEYACPLSMSSVVALRPWTEMLKESVNRVVGSNIGFLQVMVGV
jgi:hypothetical protein